MGFDNGGLYEEKMKQLKLDLATISMQSLQSLLLVNQNYNLPHPYNPSPEEVGHDVGGGLSQCHMTLERSLEWNVAFLVIEAQPVMKGAVLSHLCSCRQCLRVFCKSKGWNRYDSMKWYLSFVIWKFSGNEKDERTSTDFSRVMKDGQLGYGATSYFSLVSFCL